MVYRSEGVQNSWTGYPLQAIAAPRCCWGSGTARAMQGSSPARPYDLLRGAAATSAATAPEALPPEDPQLRRQRTEAVLLLAKGPLTTRKVAQLADLADATEARTLIRHLNRLYDEHGRAIRAEEVAGGVQLLTRPQFAPWLRRLGHMPATIRLSSPAMETLAVVAYRQPVLRADIEAIRGVACGELLRQLMDRDLVRICGRSEELGRPYLYATTKRFLQVFGLRSTDSLPKTDFTLGSPQSEPDDYSSDQVPTSFDSGVTDKESDVSTALATVVLDAAPGTDLLTGGVSAASAVIAAPNEPVASLDDDEEDDFLDDDEDDDWDDDDWDDDDEEDDDDDEEESEWEEVGDEDEEEDEEDVVDEDDVEAEEVVEDEEEEWVEEEDDDDWDEDDEEDDDLVEEEDEEEEEWS